MQTASRPRVGKVGALDAKIRESCGCGVEDVKAGHVARNPKLRRQLESFGLSDFFDENGGYCCRKMGLTFMASLSEPEDTRTWGSRIGTGYVEPAATTQSSTAFMKAQEARERDTERSRRKNAAYLEQLREDQKLKSDDVALRQIEVVFCEIPDFEKYLPSGVSRVTLRPLSVERDSDTQDRIAFEKSNQLLREASKDRVAHQMGWRYKGEELIDAVRLGRCWAKAARPLLGDLGIDRPSFSRFVLESDLVESEKAPFFWVVSLFDEVSRPIRNCGLEGTMQKDLAVTPTASYLHLVCIIDTILVARCGDDTFAAKKVLDAMPALAKARLPAHLLAEEAGRQVAFGEDDSKMQRSDSKTQQWESPLPQAAQAPSSSTPRARTQASFFAAKREATFAPWLGLAANPAESVVSPSKVDKEKRLWLARDELVHSIILEPEVLHLIGQYERVFQTLFDCYAEESAKGRNMSFKGLLRFCSDFQLAPNLIASHTLQHIYATTWCLDGPPQPLIKAGHGSNSCPDVNGEEVAPVSPLRKAKQSDSQGRKQVDGYSPPSGRTTVHNISPVSSRSTRTSTSGGHRTSTSGGHRTSTSGGHQDKPLTARLPPLTARKTVLGIFTEDEVASDAAGTSDCSPPQPPQLSPLKPVQPRVGIFGLGAFIESLIRIAVIHLEWYGNALQQSTNGMTRVVWLLCYLRYVFSGYLAKLQEGQRSDELADKFPAAEQLGGLLAALRDLPTALWETPARAPDENWPQWRSVVRPSLSAMRGPISKKTVDGKKSLPSLATRSMKATATKVLLTKHLGHLGKNSIERAPSKNSSRNPSKSSTICGDSPAAVRRSSRESSMPFSKDAIKENGIPHRKRSCEAIPGRMNPKRDVETPDGEEIEDMNQLFTKNNIGKASADTGLSLGEPWILSGRCRLCKINVVMMGGWGRPTCYGCSMVDAIGLESHPLRSLWSSLPEAEVVAPKAELSVQMSQLRAPLTPPELRGNIALRLDVGSPRSAAEEPRS